MKEPVARAARAEQRHVERREGRTCARAGDEGERDDGGFAGVALGPAARAGHGTRHGVRQPRRRNRRARGIRRLFVVALGFAEKVRRFLFRIGGGGGGTRAGLFGRRTSTRAGFPGRCAGSVYDLTGFFFDAGVIERFVYDVNRATRRVSDALAYAVLAVDALGLFAGVVERRRSRVRAFAQRVGRLARAFVELRSD